MGILKRERYELPFGDLDEGDEELINHCKKYLFSGYNYPCIDDSLGDWWTMIWDKEERVFRQNSERLDPLQCINADNTSIVGPGNGDRLGGFALVRVIDGSALGDVG